MLVTRPAHQAGALCEAIEVAGGIAIRLPLLAIEPVADPQAARTALVAAQQANVWLFTSTNAVRFARQLVVTPWPAQLAASGAATAAALREAGHADIWVPDQQDGAAGLLALPQLADVRAQAVAIIGGEQPLPDLAEGLTRRGAQVRVVPVYRRVPVAHSVACVIAAINTADIAIVTSSEALAALLHLVPAASHRQLLQLPLAVPSARVVEKACEAGFVHPAIVPTRVTDADWLDLLHRWRRARRTDLK